jgi:DNA-binding NarL/FixJ family response regulator
MLHFASYFLAQPLIADDHPLFRKGMHRLLDSVTGIEVVGEATEGEEAIALAERRQPDVTLMDINMPGMNGIEATRRILHVSPFVGVLVLTMYEDDDSVFAAMRVGARGYLLKGVDQAEVLRAINAVSRGEAIFSPSIARRLIHYFSTLEKTVSRVFPELTDREREVLTLIAQGHTNAAIAEKLVLSPKTVRNHVSTIFSKLQVASRAEAIIRARDAGLTYR